MYEGSSAKVPTSAYSVSLTLAESVGGWDPDAFAVSLEGGGGLAFVPTISGA
jgi:hypothetical protein